MWKFQEVLNVDLAILLVMLAGILCVLVKIYRQDDMRVFNLFLFKLTLPASVIMGLGLKTDLYDGEIWRFIGAFLMMRGIMLAACTLLFGVVLRRSLGEVTTNWLSTTWISTVTIGVPLLSALLGKQYGNLGVVAGVSSFIFQLPVMLIMYEVHTWRQENLHARLPEVSSLSSSSEQTEAEAKRQATAAGKQQHGPLLDATVPTGQEELAPSPQALAASGASDGSFHRGSGDDRLLGCLHFRMTRAQAKRLGLRLLSNHILWGCAIGIILSLSKLGPKYLDPGNPPAKPNPTYAVGAGFIAALLDYFARCTEPVAFFATGMWMVRRNPIPCGIIQAVLYMVVKLILVPALMVGCAFAVGLEGAAARAAVLVATLPVSAAAFALSKTYGVREDVAVANVFLGNLLVLPTTIAWLEFMDGIDLFT